MDVHGEDPVGELRRQAIFLLSQEVTMRNIVTAILCSAGGYIAPDMSLDRRAKDRAKSIERELPDPQRAVDFVLSQEAEDGGFHEIRASTFGIVKIRF